MMPANRRVSLSHWRGKDADIILVVQGHPLIFMGSFKFLRNKGPYLQDRSCLFLPAMSWGPLVVFT